MVIFRGSAIGDDNAMLLEAQQRIA
jgi:hypothetical protein